MDVLPWIYVIGSIERMRDIDVTNKRDTGLGGSRVDAAVNVVYNSHTMVYYFQD